MNDVVEVEPTEEELAEAARLRAVRARRAIAATPAVVAHLRQLVEGSPLRSEPGRLAQWRSPLLTQVTDDADRVFATLQTWVDIWRESIAEGTLARVPVHGWWTVDRDARGLPAGLSVERARKATAALAGWLQQHEDRILKSGRGLSVATYQDAFIDLVRHLQGKYPTSPRIPREASARPCPVCGELAVHVEMFGQSFESAARREEFELAVEFDASKPVADSRQDPKHPDSRKILTALSGVDVHCEYCGWVGVPKPATILEWLS